MLKFKMEELIPKKMIFLKKDPNIVNGFKFFENNDKLYMIYLFMKKIEIQLIDDYFCEKKEFNINSFYENNEDNFLCFNYLSFKDHLFICIGSYFGKIYIIKVSSKFDLIKVIDFNNSIIKIDTVLMNNSNFLILCLCKDGAVYKLDFLNPKNKKKIYKITEIYLQPLDFCLNKNKTKIAILYPNIKIVIFDLNSENFLKPENEYNFQTLQFVDQLFYLNDLIILKFSNLDLIFYAKDENNYYEVISYENFSNNLFKNKNFSFYENKIAFFNLDNEILIVDLFVDPFIIKKFKVKYHIVKVELLKNYIGILYNNHMIEFVKY